MLDSSCLHSALGLTEGHLELCVLCSRAVLRHHESDLRERRPKLSAYNKAKYFKQLFLLPGSTEETNPLFFMLCCCFLNLSPTLVHLQDGPPFQQSTLEQIATGCKNVPVLYHPGKKPHVCVASTGLCICGLLIWVFWNEAGELLLTITKRRAKQSTD